MGRRGLQAHWVNIWGGGGIRVSLIPAIGQKGLTFTSQWTELRRGSLLPAIGEKGLKFTSHRTEGFPYYMPFVQKGFSITCYRTEGSPFYQLFDRMGFPMTCYWREGSQVYQLLERRVSLLQAIGQKGVPFTSYWT